MRRPPKIRAERVLRPAPEPKRAPPRAPFPREPAPAEALAQQPNQAVLSALGIRRKCAAGAAAGDGASGRRRGGAGGIAPLVRALEMSRGEALARPVRTEFETLFAADFSSVRIHRDAAAGRAARAVGALAFARDASIYFRDAGFQPAALPDRRLLAHELTHVVQQRAARSTLEPPPAGTGSEDAREREADAAASRVVERRPPERLTQGVPSSTIARQRHPGAATTVDDPADAGTTDASALDPVPGTAASPATSADRRAEAPASPDSTRAAAPAPGAGTLTFENRLLSPSREWCRYVLTQAWIAGGEAATASFVTRFHDRVAEVRFNRSDMSGVTEESEGLSRTIEHEAPIAEALDAEWAALSAERDAYLVEFRSRAEITTAGMLDLSRQRVTSELDRYGLSRTETTRRVWHHDEGARYSEDETTYHYGMAGSDESRQSTDRMAAAARELAAGVRRVKAAVEERNSAYGLVPSTTMSDDPGVMAMKYGIVDQARHAEAMRHLEQAERDYARLRFEGEQDFPILASYSTYDQQGGGRCTWRSTRSSATSRRRSTTSNRAISTSGRCRR